MKGISRLLGNISIQTGNLTFETSKSKQQLSQLKTQTSDAGWESVLWQLLFGNWFSYRWVERFFGLGRYCALTPLVTQYHSLVLSSISLPVKIFTQKKKKEKEKKLNRTKNRVETRIRVIKYLPGIPDVNQQQQPQVA